MSRTMLNTHRLLVTVPLVVALGLSLLPSADARMMANGTRLAAAESPKPYAPARLPRDGAPMDPGGLLQSLDLSAAQQQRIQAIRQQTRAQGQILRRQIREKQHGLMTYVKSADSKEAQAQRMFNEVNVLQRQLGELRMKAWFQIRETLTPVQIQKLEQLLQQVPARKGPMPGRAPAAGNESSVPPSGAD